MRFSSVPRFIKTLFFVFVMLLVLVACGQEESSPGDDIYAANIEQEVTRNSNLDSTSAQQVATTFLDNWKKEDYLAMYTQISPNSRDAFPLEEFSTIYEEVDEILKLRNVDYSIQSVLVEGSTATVSYQVTFDSTLFGQFGDPPNPDETRLMRLITTDEGWRIAWSRMEILSGWDSNTRLVIERTQPSRGNIYDRDGNILVDHNGVAIGINISKQEIPTDQPTCIAELSRILSRDPAEIQELFDRNPQDNYFFVGEISRETAQAERATLDSICQPEYNTINVRQYYGKVAPHLIGYVGQIPEERLQEFRNQGYPDDALVGIEGIETAFEDYLAGTIDIRVYLRSQQTGQIVREVAARPGQPGQSLYLTLDRDLQLGIQSMFEEAYAYAQPTWGRTSPGAAAVVMEVNTGEVLAMASYPDFDPGVFNPRTPIPNPQALIAEYKTDERKPLVNRATQSRYPLGSVFKIFTMIAGLDSEIWNWYGTASCDGVWEGELYGDIRREDWYLGLGLGFGYLDAHDALVASCNIFFWTQAMTLNSTDPNVLPDYAKMMGFGQAVDFQGIRTDPGLIPNPAWKESAYNGIPWTLSDALNLGIGQGEISVNPLQVVRAVAAVANDGTLYDPVIAERAEILGSDEIVTFEAESHKLEVSPEVMAHVRDAMCQVTLNRQIGTANYVYQEWYDQTNSQIIVCGKTGTAQTVPGRQPHAWFAAYAPDDNPEIAIVVVVEHSCEGSEVSAPIVQRIVDLYFGLEHNVPWPQLWVGGCQTIGPD